MSNQTGCHQFSLLLSLSYLENVKAQLAEITETKPKKWGKKQLCFTPQKQQAKKQQQISWIRQKK